MKRLIVLFAFLAMPIEAQNIASTRVTAASDLSNGVTGTGTVVLNTAPTLSGAVNGGSFVASGSFVGTDYKSFGSVPTATGTCAISAQVGGNTAGSFKANGACVLGTVILTFGTTSTVGWSCFAVDMTTPADILSEAAYTTNSVTLSGSMASGDQVAFHCMRF